MEVEAGDADGVRAYGPLGYLDGAWRGFWEDFGAAHNGPATPPAILTRVPKARTRTRACNDRD